MTIYEYGYIPKKLIEISIRFPEICNLNCWFCVQGHKPEKHDFSIIDKVNKNIDKLINVMKYIHNKNNEFSFRFRLIVGEPCLFDLDKILYEFKDAKNVEFSIITNGTLPDMLKKCDPYNFKYSVSLHESEYNAFEVFDKLPKNHLNKVSIVDTGLNGDFINSFKQAYPSAKINLQPLILKNKRIPTKTGKKYYIDNRLVTISEVDDLLRNSKIDMTNAICNSEYSITFDGLTIQMHNCNTSRSLSNSIKEDDFKLEKRCKLNKCVVCCVRYIKNLEYFTNDKTELGITEK